MKGEREQGSLQPGPRRIKIDLKSGANNWADG